MFHRTATAHTSLRTNTGAGCLIVFALPFAAVGVVVAYFVVAKALRIADLQNWPSIEGTLHSVELVIDSGETDTYSVAAKYSYEYQGRSYQSDSVSPYMSDNIGDFHQRTYQKLHAHLLARTPVEVYVNPNNPAESMLTREVRLNLLLFMMMFAVVFGLVGFGLIVLVLQARRKAQRTAELKSTNPTAPWYHRDDWKSGKIFSEQGSMALTLLVIAIIWNGISFPILFAIWPECQKGNYAILLGLIFPLIGIGLLWAAIVSTLRWRRFGRARLELSTIPIEPGRELRGTIYVGNKLEHAKQISVELVCRKHDRHHTSDGTSIQTSEVWSYKEEFDLRPSMSMTRESMAEIQFLLPSEAQETSEIEGVGVYYSWLVRANAQIPGADFSAQFEVPVFRKDPRGPSLQHSF